MKDNTEQIRRQRIVEINSQKKANTEEEERKRLQKKYGQVWDTEQLAQEFNVVGFLAPFVVAKRKVDGKRGSLEFQHCPRFYFSWKED